MELAEEISTAYFTNLKKVPADAPRSAKNQNIYGSFIDSEVLRCRIFFAADQLRGSVP
jgi:hypothetical protein